MTYLVRRYAISYYTVKSIFCYGYITAQNVTTKHYASDMTYE